MASCPGYKLPSYAVFSEQLLDDADARIRRAAEPVLQRSTELGCSIVMDGWSDAASNPLINALVVNAKGTYFLFAEDTTGQRKTGEYLSELASKAIDMLGHEQVVAVIADSASSNIAAGERIELE